MRIIRNHKRATVAAAVATIVVGAGAGVAYAAGNAGGNTEAVVELSSIASPYYSFLDLGEPGHGNRLSDIQTLSTDFAALSGSDCGLGSPRFSIAVEVAPHVTKNIFVYLGAPPNFTSCAPGWRHSGNLTDPSTSWDTSQLGGAFYDTAGNALASFGSDKVNDVSLVVDGQNQDFVFTNVALNGHVQHAHIG